MSRGWTTATPVEVEVQDPTELAGIELLDRKEDFECRICMVYYGGSGGVEIHRHGLRGSTVMVMVLCKWCLAKLAITILERRMG